MLRVVFLLLGLTLGTFARAHDNGQWEGTDPAVRDWYQGLMQPDLPKVSCCGVADAYWADGVIVRGDKVFAVITDTREDKPLGRPHVPVGTEIEVPVNKMKYDRGNPTGHTVIFLSTQRYVYCYVQGTGI